MKQNSKTSAFISSNVLILFLIVLCIVMSILKPTFITPENITNVLIQVSINALLATGMTFVILTGGIDLSVGSVAALSGVLAAYVIKLIPTASVGLSLLITLLVALGVAFIAGSIVGLAVSRLNVAPFISTLAMLSIARGMAYIITDGKPIFELADSFKWMGQYRLFGSIPMLVLLVAVVMLIAYILLSRTPYGRYIYAVGSSEHVAYLSGVNSRNIKYSVYVISAFLAALGGIALSSKLGTGQPSGAVGYELDAIAAVVLGGTSLSGGKGGIGKTVVGVLTIGVINNGLNLLQVNTYWQQIIMGAIILIAVIMDQFKLRSKV